MGGSSRKTAIGANPGVFIGFTLSCRFHGWDWFGWLESRTVTANSLSPARQQFVLHEVAEDGTAKLGTVGIAPARHAYGLQPTDLIGEEIDFCCLAVGIESGVRATGTGLCP
jgi:hypothetical protein